MWHRQVEGGFGTPKKGDNLSWTISQTSTTLQYSCWCVIQEAKIKRIMLQSARGTLFGSIALISDYFRTGSMRNILRHLSKEGCSHESKLPPSVATLERRSFGLDLSSTHLRSSGQSCARVWRLQTTRLICDLRFAFERRSFINFTNSANN